MKVAGLLFATLSLVAVAQGSYKLSCAKSELGIRWPSYESNSEYYVCPRLFGKQATISCNPGEIFTFALQSCTSPNRFIPAPPLEVLPTASPLMSKPNKEGYLTPLEINNDVHPPIVNQFNPSVPETVVPEHQMPGSLELPKAPVVTVEEPKHEQVPVMKEEQPLPLAPLPPTPAPTPPVMQKETHKKPHGPAGKKPPADKKKKSSAKPGKSAKKPAAAAKNPKKPAKSSKTPSKKTPKKV